MLHISKTELNNGYAHYLLGRHWHRDGAWKAAQDELNLALALPMPPEFVSETERLLAEVLLELGVCQNLENFSPRSFSVQRRKIDLEARCRFMAHLTPVEPKPPEPR